MIIISKILATTGLYQWIGRKQPTLSDSPVLDAGNKISNSGEYYRDGLTGVNNIHTNQEDNAITVGNFNTYLVDFAKEGIIKALRKVFNKADLKENRILFTEENVMTNTAANATDFVGYEINVSDIKDIAVRINQIIMTFDAAEAFRIYLFNSNSNAAINSTEITSVANTDVSQGFTDWILSNNDYKGGKWYIGYLTDGRTAKAVNREWNNASIRSRYNYIGIRPIKVSGWNVNTLFDVDDIEYVSETHGMNFDISVHQDFTDEILRNKENYTELLKLQMEVDVLELIWGSTRSNRTSRLNQDVFIDLWGDEEAGVVGIITQLEREIKNLQNSFNPKMKIKAGTIR